MSWDPTKIDRAIAIQKVMDDIQKAQFKEPPSGVEVATENPVPKTVEAFKSQGNYDYKRTYEVLSDPPATVFKYQNKQGEVLTQIPSEVSLKIYKQMLDYIDRTKGK